MNSCIVWGGAVDRDGYGTVNVRSLKTKSGWMTAMAHRLAYADKYGPIPAGLVVCHTCDNPPCINPDHLFVGTQSDNVRDMRTKGRAAPHTVERTHCKNGHEFTEENTFRKDNGSQGCVTCRRIRSLAYRHRNLTEVRSYQREYQRRKRGA